MGKLNNNTGFTLLELLVVITLLGIVAGAVVIGYEDVQEQGREDMARFEMAEIRKALLQFRRDTQELPCRVYRDGAYAPDATGISELDFTGLPSTPDNADYHAWCQDQHSGQVDWGLSMLLKFPYDDTGSAYRPLLWNPDTRRGWHGPYLNRHGLFDPWGNRYRLLDPELDYPPDYRCKASGSHYDATGGLYDCISPDDLGFDSNYSLPANIARLVSNGANGAYDSENAPDACTAEGDDVIICLMQ